MVSGFGIDFKYCIFGYIVSRVDDGRSLVRLIYGRDFGEEWIRVFCKRVEVKVVNCVIDGIENILRGS